MEKDTTSKATAIRAPPSWPQTVLMWTLSDFSRPARGHAHLGSVSTQTFISFMRTLSVSHHKIVRKVSVLESKRLS